MFRAVVYRSKRPFAGQRWRWVVYAANNRKVGTSGEAFEHPEDAESTLRELLHPDIPVSRKS